MLTLFCIGVVIAVTMTAVTVYAVASAKEGFEDYLGFHAVLPAARSEANGTSGKNDSETDPFPLAAAR